MLVNHLVLTKIYMQKRVLIHINTTSFNYQNLKTKVKLLHFLPKAPMACSVNCGGCLWEPRKLRQHSTARGNKCLRERETKKRARLTGHWSSLCDLISLLLLRLEYHPLDPLTGISDSVDTVVRAAPQPECHRSTRQHTIKMTSAAPLGGVHVPAKSPLSSSKAVI